MKTRLPLICAAVAVLTLFDSCTVAQNETNPCTGLGNEYYSAAEIDNILCGYSIDRECLIKEYDRSVIYHTADVIIKLSVLGAGMDLTINLLYKIDPETNQWYYNETRIVTGATLRTITEIRGDTAYYSDKKSSIPKAIPLPDDLEFETNLAYPHLVRDFIKNGQNEATYKVFDVLSGQVIEKKYTLLGSEDIILNDSSFSSIKLQETDLSKGTKAILWLDRKNGMPLKTNIAGRNIYLTDKSVVSKITKVNFDNVIFARVNKIIPDFQKLTYMKVNAHIESFGETITVESLNSPGQKFTGTVTENVVKGEFELEPLNYDGTDAPAFPPNFKDDKDLQKYLEPEKLIESDDPELIAQAQRITSGAKDSWEAVKRLSRWVAENIEGAIPGGTSAINTYKTRQGECGSHSRLLAAFCRSVGIPARLSVGCIYTTHYQGSFGQHAWNEVYMGKAGWIPVDATIYEIDHIDAGHIRLGESTTFQPKEMEILDYKVTFLEYQQ